MAGRPSKYTEAFAEQAAKLCKLGATDVEIADFFEVSVRTIANWQAQHPEFLQALKRGKAEADERVERSLYAKATGYTFDAVKIFMPAGAASPVYAPYREHVAPDTTAMIFWLKNRKPDEWRDRQEHTGTGGGPISLVYEWRKSSESTAATRPAASSSPTTNGANGSASESPTGDAAKPSRTSPS